MYLAYLDECGDDGLINSSTHYYCVTCLIVHESGWEDTFQHIKTLKKDIRHKHGIPIRQELHAEEIVNNKGIGFKYKISPAKGEDIFQMTVDELTKMNIRVFSCCIRKDELTKRDFPVLTFAWSVLCTRLHTTISRINLNKGRGEKIILIADNTKNEVVRKLLRMLRVFNPVNGENVKLESIIEDPFFRDSKHSNFLQMVDMCAYMSVAKSVNIKKFEPFKFKKKYAGLSRIIEKSVCKENNEGIVYFPKIKDPA